MVSRPESNFVDSDHDYDLEELTHFPAEESTFDPDVDMSPEVWPSSEGKGERDGANSDDVKTPERDPDYAPRRLFFKRRKKRRSNIRKSAGRKNPRS